MTIANQWCETSNKKIELPTINRRILLRQQQCAFIQIRKLSKLGLFDDQKIMQWDKSEKKKLSGDLHGNKKRKMPCLYG